jgi:hypothetical protein
MHKRYLMVCGLVCAVLISAKGAGAVDAYTVCVGDCTSKTPVPPGAGPGAGQVDYRYGCDFAKANPTGLAHAAAKRVCYVEQATKSYTDLDHIPYLTIPATQTEGCGSVFFYVLCK